MEYFITFIEGIITFVSPCLLPVLPVYISIFAGGGEEKSSGLKNALGFVLGFSMVFVALGSLAGSLGAFLSRYETWVNVVTGAFVILMGLSYLGLFEIPFFQRGGGKGETEKLNFGKALVLGLSFSLAWTPCLGTFLGSALMLASQQGTALKGFFLLLIYSLGLGIPFLLAAVLTERIKATTAWIKKNYRLVKLVSGILLLVTGCLMATGTMGKLLNFFA
ncbi:MAG: cytochrome c biogenesis protein CcdA [Eubacterium sp.]|nr:cytochrome c biogenesis protein CcdA [Eubacterium sp.]